MEKIDYIEDVKNLNKGYVDLLFKQFVNAMGYETEVTIPEVYYDFFNWLIEYRIMLCNYSDYIKSLGINIDNKRAFEINKGVLDTLTINTKAKQISNYRNETSKNASICYQNDKLYIVKDGKIHPLHSDLIMTHNPYEGELNSKQWAKMFNGNIPILYGMCGKLSDADKTEKEDKLQAFIKKTNGEYFYDHVSDTKSNEYFTAVWSKSLKKTLF